MAATIALMKNGMFASDMKIEGGPLAEAKAENGRQSLCSISSNNERSTTQKSKKIFKDDIRGKNSSSSKENGYRSVSHQKKNKQRKW